MEGIKVSNSTLLFLGVLIGHVSESRVSVMETAPSIPNACCLTSKVIEPTQTTFTFGVERAERSKILFLRVRADCLTWIVVKDH